MPKTCYNCKERRECVGIDLFSSSIPCTDWQGEEPELTIDEINQKLNQIYFENFREYPGIS